MLTSHLAHKAFRFSVRPSGLTTPENNFFSPPLYMHSGTCVGEVADPFLHPFSVTLACQAGFCLIPHLVEERQHHVLSCGGATELVVSSLHLIGARRGYIGPRVFYSLTTERKGQSIKTRCLLVRGMQRVLLSSQGLAPRMYLGRPDVPIL